MDSRENEINNKNTRKLKKNDIYQMQNSRLDENDVLDSNKERRAKSSLGEHSATRVRTKLSSNKNEMTSAKLMMINQLRGNSSSAMSRLHHP